MNQKLKILMVFGTRPEVIKLASVIKEINKFPKDIECTVCVTGQHREMIDPLLDLFEIKVDYDLNLMQKNQDLEHITSTVLKEIGKIIDKEQYDYLMVQGDTTTAMAASMAAFYKKVKIAHVEAGLRTWDLQHPYPEEANRRIIDIICDLYGKSCSPIQFIGDSFEIIPCFKLVRQSLCIQQNSSAFTVNF